MSPSIYEISHQAVISQIRSPNLVLACPKLRVALLDFLPLSSDPFRSDLGKCQALQVLKCDFKGEAY